jgi:hypothetical protein
MRNLRLERKEKINQIVVYLPFHGEIKWTDTRKTKKNSMTCGLATKKNKTSKEMMNK